VSVVVVGGRGRTSCDSGVEELEAQAVEVGQFWCEANENEGNEVEREECWVGVEAGIVCRDKEAVPSPPSVLDSYIDRTGTLTER
jgi:hypothetical protein